MIKANELRIGNILLNKHTKDTITVESVSKEGVNIKLEYGTMLGFHMEMFLFDDIDPIPLTEEWLLKFGFENPDNNGRAFRLAVDHYREFCYYRMYDELKYQTIGSGFTTDMDHIKYVHQLQNLHFALTGDGLTIKETIT